MAVIYFTNNADAGTGSLRATIASAQPGDVIRPDESVFERGATIEIALASSSKRKSQLCQAFASQFSTVKSSGGGTTKPI